MTRASSCLPGVGASGSSNDINAYIHANVHTCILVCMPTRLPPDAWKARRLHACMHAFAYTCVHACMQAHTHMPACMHICAGARAYTCMHTNMCLCTYWYTHACVCMHVRVYTYMCVNLCTYQHTPATAYVLAIICIIWMCRHVCICFLFVSMSRLRRCRYGCRGQHACACRCGCRWECRCT